jgi:hypothetical protein
MATRLEKTLFRLEAQYACIGWAVQQISGRQGVVFELGLGKGRTFHHLRHLLPDRRIVVFERQVGSYPDCTPDPDQLILGDLAETLPAAAKRFAGQVILANSDVGSFESAHNEAMAKIVGDHLPPALAPGALVMSDLPLDLKGAEALDLPDGARPGSYYLYRAP